MRDWKKRLWIFPRYSVWLITVKKKRKKSNLSERGSVNDIYEYESRELKGGESERCRKLGTFVIGNPFIFWMEFWLHCQHFGRSEWGGKKNKNNTTEFKGVKKNQYVYVWYTHCRTDTYTEMRWILISRFCYIWITITINTFLRRGFNSILTRWTRRAK